MQIDSRAWAKTLPLSGMMVPTLGDQEGLGTAEES